MTGAKNGAGFGSLASAKDSQRGNDNGTGRCLPGACFIVGEPGRSRMR